MQVYLDDNPVDVSDQAGMTVRQVAQQVRECLAPQERMLVAIHIDGHLVERDRLDEVLDSPAGEHGKIDFQSAVPRMLAREVLVHARALVAEAAPIREQAGEMLAAGQTARAMEMLGSCFAVWSQVQESMSRSVELLGLDLDQLQVDGKPASQMLDEFAQRLREVKEALENRDYVTLADILQYELQDTTERWQALLDLVIEQIDMA